MALLLRRVGQSPFLRGRGGSSWSLGSQSLNSSPLRQWQLVQCCCPGGQGILTQMGCTNVAARGIWQSARQPPSPLRLYPGTVSTVIERSSSAAGRAPLFSSYLGGTGQSLRIQMAWGSTMKKRRTKMNKHKLKKRRKAARMKSSAKQNA